MSLPSVQPNISLAFARAIRDLSVGGSLVPIRFPSCALFLHLARRSRQSSFDEHTIATVVPSIVELAFKVVGCAGTVAYDFSGLSQSLAHIALSIPNPSVILDL